MMKANNTIFNTRFREFDIIYRREQCIFGILQLHLLIGSHIFTDLCCV